MGVNWTKEQQQVIDLKNRNILVSAAAGSGKTAVLVERILKKMTRKENPVDIDRLLIVTFTRATAGEMRERLTAAVEKRLEEDPDNEHLQRQQTLIYNAQITTIDETANNAAEQAAAAQSAAASASAASESASAAENAATRAETAANGVESTLAELAAAMDEI